MPNFKDFKSLESYLKKKIDNALENEVAETIKSTQQEVIQDVVYEAYTPKFYERRGRDGGGLGDIENMHSTVKDGVLTVTNLTEPNPDYEHNLLKSQYIDTAVEYGQRYDYFNPGARPFNETTIERLQNNKKHIEAIRRGLKRQGINTK